MNNMFVKRVINLSGRPAEGKSNPIIIDKKGVIRYYASGRVEDKDIATIEELLKSLVREN